MITCMISTLFVNNVGFYFISFNDRSINFRTIFRSVMDGTMGTPRFKPENNSG